MKRFGWFTVLMLFAYPASRAGAGIVSQGKRQACCTVANIKVEGAKAFTTDQIIVLAKLKSEPVAGEQTIALATERLRRAYANRGYITARVNIEPNPESPPENNQGVVDIDIKIDEGSVFRLRRLEFIGNATTNDRIVRRCVLQQEGEPYSQDSMEGSLRRLNGLKRFERITMTNVESHIDDQDHIIDLLVHLKETRSRRVRR